MNNKCIICKTTDDIGPKLVSRKDIIDERFKNPVMTLKTYIMCKSCYTKLKNKEITTKD